MLGVCNFLRKVIILEKDGGGNNRATACVTVLPLLRSQRKQQESNVTD